MVLMKNLYRKTLMWEIKEKFEIDFIITFARLLNEKYYEI